MSGSLLRRLELVVAVGLAAWVVASTASALARAWNFTADDAFITLRYARNLAAGHGIVWNVGEAPLEGYSNFSFVLLGACALGLGVDPVLVLKWTGVVGLFGAFAASYVLARRWVGPALAVVPSLLMGAFMGVLAWTVSGLETSLYLAASLGAIACTAVALGDAGGERDSPRPALGTLAAVFAFVAALTRPEGALVAACCAAALLLSGAKFRARRLHPDSLRGALRFSRVFGVPYALYFVFRLTYFGHLLPNSARCKMGWPEAPWFLVREFLVAAWPVVLVAAAYPSKTLDARRALPWSVVLLYVFVFHDVDPVVGGFLRHFMLPLALVLVLAVATVGALIARARAYTSGLEVLAALALAIVAMPKRALAAESAERWGSFYWFRAGTRASVGRYLRDTLAADASYVVGDAGVIGYLAPQRSIDAYCLNSAEMTSPSIARQKPAFVDWLYTQSPRAIVVHTNGNDPNAVAPAYGVYPEIVKRRAFTDRYVLAGRYGVPDDSTWYFVYVAKPDGAAAR